MFQNTTDLHDLSCFTHGADLGHSPTVTYWDDIKKGECVKKVE